MELEGKVALVTGALGGMGKAVSLALAKKGANLGLVDRPSAAGEELVREIEGLGARATFLAVDLASRKAVEEAVAGVLGALGRIDCLATCHAYDAVGHPFMQDREEDWDLQIAVNFKGVLYLCQAVIPTMIRQGNGGRIINITSDSVKVGLGNGAVNAATKGAVAVFSKSLARELARYNILVNCVCPGPTETPSLRPKLEGEVGQKTLEGLTRGILLRRLAQPEEIASTIAFLASDGASFITGQLISVSGGLSIT